MRTCSLLAVVISLSVFLIAGCQNAGDSDNQFGKSGNSGTPPGLTMAKGANTPSDSEVSRSEPNVPMLQFTLTAGTTEDVIVNGISMHATGTGDDSADISSASIFRDVNLDGQFSPGTDTLAVFGLHYTANNGSLAGTAMNLTIPAGATQTFILIYQFAGSADTGETFGVSLNVPADVQAVGASSSLAAAVTLTPFTGRTVTISPRGSITVAVGPQPPAGGPVDPSAPDLEVIQVSLTTDSVEAVDVAQIYFSASGTLNDQSHLSSVVLARDNDSDGVYSAGTDTLIQAGAYSADDGAAIFTFGGTPRTIPAGTTENWLLVYNFSSPIPGATFAAGLSTAAAVTASGATSGLALIPFGSFPVSGPQFEIRNGTLTVTAGGAFPTAQTLTPIATAAVSQINLAANAVEDIQVNSVSFTASGSGNDSNDLSNVDLWADVGATPGALDGGDAYISNAAYGQDNGTVTFAALSRTILAGTSENWILVYTFAGGNNNDTYSASIAPTSQVTGTGALSAKSATIAGTAINGNLFTVQFGSMSIATGTQNPNASTITPPVVGIPVLQITLATGPAESVNITQITFHASGTGDDLNDLSQVNLYLDGGTVKGQVDPSDTHIGAGSYGSDDGSVTFSISRTINASSSEDWLLAYDFSGGAGGATYSASITPSSDVTAAGSQSGRTVTASGSQITSNAVTIASATAMTWNPLKTQGGTGGSPGGLRGHSMVYDSNNSRILMFGGCSSTGTPSAKNINNDLWELTLGSGTPTWNKLASATIAPPASMWHSAVHDATNGYMYIYGGYDGTSDLPANATDIWRFDTSNNSWACLTTINGPPKPRRLHMAVWDSNNGQMVLYGGINSTMNYFNDAWTLTFGGKQPSWSNLSIVNTAPKNEGMSCGWDCVSSKRMVLFGGYDGSNYDTNTYDLDPSSPQWQQLSPKTNPTAVSRMCFDTDGSNGKLYIFGGTDASACYQDTYYFDFSQNDWTQITGGTTLPSKRCESAGAWDSANNRFIIYGGWNPHSIIQPIAPYSDCHELK